MPREAIARIGIQMWPNGLLIEGIIVFLCFDAWLREQDWELFRGEDCVADNHNQMALLTRTSSSWREGEDRLEPRRHLAV